MDLAIGLFVGALIGAWFMRWNYRDEVVMRGHGRWNPMTREFEWKDRNGTGWEKP
jgi:hypothetical protein